LRETEKWFLGEGELFRASVGEETIGRPDRCGQSTDGTSALAAVSKDVAGAAAQVISSRC
jgi:hypothetical protein